MKYVIGIFLLAAAAGFWLLRPIPSATRESPNVPQVPTSSKASNRGTLSERTELQGPSREPWKGLLAFVETGRELISRIEKADHTAPEFASLHRELEAFESKRNELSLSLQEIIRRDPATYVALLREADRILWHVLMGILFASADGPDSFTSTAGAVHVEDLPGEFADYLLETLGSPDPERVAKAGLYVQHLGCRSPEFGQRLLPHLRSGKPEAAYSALGYFVGNPKVGGLDFAVHAGALLPLLSEATNPVHLQFAIEAVGRIRTPEADHALLNHLAALTQEIPTAAVAQSVDAIRERTQAAGSVEQVEDRCVLALRQALVFGRYYPENYTLLLASLIAFSPAKVVPILESLQGSASDPTMNDRIAQLVGALREGSGPEQLRKILYPEATFQIKPLD